MAEGEVVPQQSVLVVDDDPGVRRLASAILSRHGFRVIVAGDGAAALALANSIREPIDLVLTDVMMPVLTGEELAERLLRSRPDIRVLFMSGYPGSVTNEAAIRASFLAKPFTPRSLLERVRDTLDGPPFRSLVADK